MKDNKEIHESLRNLPKYSLNSEQKRKVLLTLSAKQQVIKKNVILKPIIITITSLVLFCFLVFQELIDKNPRTISLPEQNLTVQEGKKFTLPDTNQEVIGIEGKVALLNTFNQFVAKDKRRVAKIMTFYWGNPKELIGKHYRVEALQDNGEKITLSEGELNSALNSDDAHMLTRFEPFPTEGTWQLFFYVDENLHGTFTLDVLPSFPQTDHYTLVDSPYEFEIGKETAFTIESSQGSLEEIEVKLINEEGKVVDENKFKQITMQYDALTNKPIFLYSGSLSFPEPGNWMLIIDGETTQAFDIKP